MILKNVRAVAAFLQRADLMVQEFQSRSGLCCKQMCAHCCLKSDIEANPLEFFPAALKLYKDQTIYEIYDKVSQLDQDQTCVFLNPLSTQGGFCSVYEERGLICRLFGYSSHHNKQGDLELIACKIIKESEEFARHKGFLIYAPVLQDFYMQLYSIDYKYAVMRMPINKAIKYALETIMFYFDLKGKKAG